MCECVGIIFSGLRGRCVDFCALDCKCRYKQGTSRYERNAFRYERDTCRSVRVYVQIRIRIRADKIHTG